MDTRVGRAGQTFAQTAARIEPVENAALRVERATARLNREMEQAERAARAEGVAQERLSAVLAAGAAAKEQAALAAVRGLNQEQQALALSRAGYAGLATQIAATAQAQRAAAAQSEAAAAQLARSQAQAAALAQAYGATAAPSLDRFVASNDNAAASTGRLNAVIGQAGFQLGDFASQVSAGGNALVALGQQGSQFLGLFGAAGAIAGAALTVGVLVAQFAGIGENAGAARQRAEEAFQSMRREGEEAARVLREIGDLFLTAAERADRLAASQRENLLLAARLGQSNAALSIDAATGALPQATADVARLEREAAVEAQMRERTQRAGGMVAQSDVQERLFTARARLDGLRLEISRAGTRLGELNEQAARLQNRIDNPGVDLGQGEFGPSVPGATVTARRSGGASAARREFDAAAVAERELQRAMEDGERVRQSLRTETERFADEQDRLGRLLASGAIDQDTFNRAVQAADPALRAAARAAEEASRAQAQFERQSLDAFARIGEGALERIGQGLVTAFLQGEQGALDFGRLARATLASVASDLLRLAVINPLANAAFGTQRPTLGGAFSAMGGGGGAANDSGGGFSLSNLSSVAGVGRQVMGAFNGSGLGNFFPGGGSFGGFGSGVLNTAIHTPAAAGQMTASGFNAGTAMAGEAGAFVGGGGAASSLTIGQVLGPAAAIGGGVYGAVQGFQRGGAGGITSGVGGLVSAGTGLGMLGAAAGLLPALGALGPVGLALGAALAIGGSLLPGRRPASLGGSSNINFATGLSSSAFTSGGRGNAAAAMGDAGDIFAQARAISDRLGMAPAGGVAVGRTRNAFYLDVGRMGGRFGSEEEANAVVPDWLFDAFRLAANDNPNTRAGRIVLGSTSLDDLRTNIDFAPFAESFRAGTVANNDFAAQVRALGDEIGPMVDRARRIGISTEQFEEEYRQRIGLLNAQRTAGVLGIQAGIAARLGGNPELQRRAAEASRALAELTEAREVRGQLDRLGVAAEDTARMLADLGEAQRRERDAAVAAAANPAASGIRDFLDRLAVTPGAALSVPDAFAEAQRQFAATLERARGGDAAASAGIVGNAQTLLGLGAQQFASGPEFAALQGFVRSTLERLPGVRGFDAQVAGNTATMVEQMNALIAEVQALRAATVELQRENRLILENRGRAA